MKARSLLFFCCALAALGATNAAAEEAAPAGGQTSSVDSLFDNPIGDTETESSDAKQLLVPFHAQPLSVTGSFTSYAGGVLGVKDKEDDEGNYTGGYTFKASPGMSFIPVMTFSARPDETIRFQGTASFPFASTDAFAPAINEMFLDYTLQDTIYMRMGKHLVSWGVTRIFGAGGDLMSSSDQDLNMKVTVPVRSGGITGELLAPPAIMDSTFTWKKATYGLQTDVPYGRSELILSGTCYGNDDDNRPLRATAVFKTSLLGVDLFAESIAASRFIPEENLKVYPTLTGIVSGFYWSTPTPPLTFYGEYYIDATDTSWRSQFTSVVTKWDRAFGSPLNLALQWTHAYIDNSGIIIPGISTAIMPHVNLQVGLPCRYGAPGSYYLVNESPSVQTSVVKTDTLKWYQRYGLLLRLTMSASF